jgi:hypothetical protein
MSDRTTPLPIDNRAALAAIRRRIGRHPEFRESMLRGLTSIHRPGLANLEAREESDLTVAFLDAVAVSCDILTFYQERIANEAYLRTAEHRRSLRLLSRHIGYEMVPAKAASVHLAFAAEEAGAPVDTLVYPPPLQVKSVPRDGQLPQTFETVEPLHVRADWNAIRPRLSYAQILGAATDSILLAAEAPPVSVAGAVVFMRGRVPVPAVGQRSTYIRSVTAATPNQRRERRLSLSADPVPRAYLPIRYTLAPGWPPTLAFNTSSMGLSFGSANWSQSQIITAGRLTNTPLNIFKTALFLKPWEMSTADAILPHHFKVRASLFGHNAITRRAGQETDTAGKVTVASPGWVHSQNGDLDAGGGTPASGKCYVYLDRDHDDITDDSVVILRGSGHEGYARTSSVETVSIEGFGLTGRVSRLELPNRLNTPGGGTVSLASFTVRGTTVIAAPEALPLAALPIDMPVGEAQGEPDGDAHAQRPYIGADEIELDGPYLELTPGRAVVVTGMRDREDLEGVEGREVKTIAEATLNDGHTILRFSSEFAHTYVRDSVTLNANVALATHGETVQEIIGSGDARQAFQSFSLKGKPLTYISAASASGMAPALEIRVDGVLWHPLTDFCDAGPDDRVYVIRHSEDGTSRVVFGDGGRGARLPTGQANVVAVYRVGAGADGLLEADQLTLMSGKPAGLKSVSNPLPPAGAAAGETLEQVRVNAPATTLTLGRVVSLKDYEDFARSFGGIAKARADWVWDGTARPIILTVAGEGGVALPPTGPDINNLKTALRKAGDPDVPLRIFSYEPVDFTLDADLFIQAGHDPEKVSAAVHEALAGAFCFRVRRLGQPVSRSEVIAVMQAVDGVKAVDLNLLHRLDQDAGDYARLAAARPMVSAGLPDRGAELLTLSPAPAQLGIIL